MKNRSAMSDATRGLQLRAWLRRTPRRRVLSAENLTTNLWNGSAGRLLRGAAQQIGVTLAAILMDGPFQEAQYLEGFRTATGNGAQALLVGPVAEHFVNRRLVVKLAAQNQLPAVAPWRKFVEVGGSHGVRN